MTQAKLLAEASADRETIQYWTPDMRVRLLFGNFSAVRTGGVKANLQVFWNEEPHLGLVKDGWVQFGNSVAPWARELSKVAPGDLTEKDWHNIVQSACYRAQRWFAMGEPFEHLGDSEVEPVRYLVYPILTSSGATVLAAPGGTGKSFLALSLALTVATGSAKFLGLKPNQSGPVLYLDWEDEIGTQDERLMAICRRAGVEPPSDRLIYQRMRSPLNEAVSSLTRKIMELEERPVLAIIDSIGKARGGDVSSSELTNYLFSAIDKLQMPAFCIDHKSKEMIENGTSGPIGSIYTWNSARAVWDLEKSQTIGASDMVVKMSNSKNNRGKLQRPLAWEISFEMEHPDTENEILVGVEYRRMAPSNVTILTPKEQSNAQQVESVLFQADEPLTIREIEERCSLSNQAIRNALKSHPKMFDPLPGKPQRWTLWQRNEQDTLPAPF